MIILYPTETIYALGVNAFDYSEVETLYKLKKRKKEKTISVLVRDVTDIEYFAHIPLKASLLVTHFLPGPLTLILKARDFVPEHILAPDKTLGFRISSDKTAQEIIKKFMEKNHSPLTCTSANISGQENLSTVPEILKQFKNNNKQIDKIYDDGSRLNKPSTIVKVVDQKVEILREGIILKSDIERVIANKQH